MKSDITQDILVAVCGQRDIASKLPTTKSVNLKPCRASEFLNKVLPSFLSIPSLIPTIKSNDEQYLVCITIAKLLGNAVFTSLQNIITSSDSINDQNVMEWIEQVTGCFEYVTERILPCISSVCARQKAAEKATGRIHSTTEYREVVDTFYCHVHASLEAYCGRIRTTHSESARWIEHADGFMRRLIEVSLLHEECSSSIRELGVNRLPCLHAAVQKLIEIQVKKCVGQWNRTPLHHRAFHKVLEEINIYTNGFGRLGIEIHANAYEKVFSKEMYRLRLDQLLLIFLEYPETIASLNDFQDAMNFLLDSSELNRREVTEQITTSLVSQWEDYFVQDKHTTTAIRLYFLASWISTHELEKALNVFNAEMFLVALREKSDIIKEIAFAFLDPHSVLRIPAADVSEKEEENDRDKIFLKLLEHVSKEQFLLVYHEKLASQLLKSDKSNIDNESSSIDRLERLLGENSVNSFRIMLSDVVASHRLEQSIQKKPRSRIARDTSSVQVAFTILSESFWPKFPTESAVGIRWHPKIDEHLKTISRVYETKYSRRTLSWHIAHSEVEIELEQINDKRTKEHAHILTVNVVQASALLYIVETLPVLSASLGIPGNDFVQGMKTSIISKKLGISVSMLSGYLHDLVPTTLKYYPGNEPVYVLSTNRSFPSEFLSNTKEATSNKDKGAGEHDREDESKEVNDIQPMIDSVCHSILSYLQSSAVPKAQSQIESSLRIFGQLPRGAPINLIGNCISTLEIDDKVLRRNNKFTLK